MIHLSDKHWLDALVRDELGRYDADAARARLPPEVRAGAADPGDLAPAAKVLVARSLRLRRLEPGDDSPARAFEDTVRAHVGLALDLALLRGEPFLRADRRAELAAFLAAAAGEHALAIAGEPHRPGGSSDRAVERAFRAAGEALAARFYPPGDPAGGLPLHPGLVAVFRRLLARVVMGYLRADRLDAAALDRHAAYARTEVVLLAESLAGLVDAAAAPTEHEQAIRARQLSRLGLPRDALRQARRAVAEPRAAAAIAAAAPERIRPFLVEAVLLAQLRARLDGAASVRWVEAFVEAAGLEPQAVAAARVEAAAQHGDHQVWFQLVGDGMPREWQRLAEEWEDVADQIVERVTAAVTDNLEAIAVEIRGTGELGQLVAKAASGRALTRDEKRVVKRQLLDLAKAVPALAIFAAPGGLLLLPLLAKLLPFNMLPSAWDKDARAARGAGPPADAAARAAPPGEPSSRKPSPLPRRGRGSG